MFFVLMYEIIFAVVVIGGAISFMTCDENFWSTFTFVAGCVIAYFMIEPVKTLVNSYGLSALIFAIPAYLLAGLMVMLLKWFLQIRQFGKWLALQIVEFSKITEYQYSFGHTYLMSDPANQNRYAFLDYLITTPDYKASHDHYSKGNKFSKMIDTSMLSNPQNRGIIAESPDKMIEAITPKMSQHVYPLTFWILNWPITLIALVVQNFVIELVNNVIELFDGTFKKLNKAIVKRLIKDVSI